MTLINGRAVIGAIPGYNLNIDKDGQYAKKLMSNINTVVLEPCGYALNLSTGISGLATVDVKNNNQSLTNSGELFKIGSNVTSNFSFGNETNVTTENALSIWKNILNSISKSQSSMPETCKINTDATGLEFLCTNDSTFTEVFSNNYKASWLDDAATSAASVLAGKIGAGLMQKIQNVKNMAASFDSGLGRAVMRDSLAKANVSDGTGGDILSLLAAKTLGYQTTLPKEWVNSNYDNGLQLMIRLVSPSGHYEDIFNYIVNPILYIVGAAAPVTYNGIAFGYPPLWRIKAQGLQNVTLGAISTVTIQRGGTDTIFNKFNQPLNVDVRISLESIIAGYATGIVTEHKDFYKGMSEETRPSIVTNPQDIVDSFTYLSGTKGDNTAKEISVKL